MANLRAALPRYKYFEPLVFHGLICYTVSCDGSIIGQRSTFYFLPDTVVKPDEKGQLQQTGSAAVGFFYHGTLPGNDPAVPDGHLPGRHFFRAGDTALSMAERKVWRPARSGQPGDAFADCICGAAAVERAPGNNRCASHQSG